MIPWPDPTTLPDCDQALEELRAAAPRWTSLELDERIQLLSDVAEGVIEAAEDWVELSCRAKGIERGSSAESEEWLAGPWTVLRHVKLQTRTLLDIKAHGSPRLPGKSSVNQAGRIIAPIFPTDPLDSIVFRGVKAEVWMEQGVHLEELEESMG